MCSFSPYSTQTKHGREVVVFNKEGYDSPTTCGMHQGVHRELVIGNLRALGPLHSSRLSVTYGRPSNSDLAPTSVEVPN